MFTSYTLDEGTKVDVPFLNGVLEHALQLMEEWQEKNSALKEAPSYLLLFNALTCADLVRTVDAFKKAGMDEDIALRFAHSRLPEVFMYAGVSALLGINTWWLDNKIASLTDPPNAFGLTEDNASGPDRFKKREPWDELRRSAEFTVEMTNLVGPEATDLLFQACQAYDRWVREVPKKAEGEDLASKKAELEKIPPKQVEFLSIPTKIANVEVVSLKKAELEGAPEKPIESVSAALLRSDITPHQKTTEDQEVPKNSNEARVEVKPESPVKETLLIKVEPKNTTGKSPEDINVALHQADIQHPPKALEGVGVPKNTIEDQSSTTPKDSEKPKEEEKKQ